MDDYQQVIASLRTAYSREQAEQRNQTEKDAWKVAERQQFLALLQQEGKTTLLEIGAGTGNDSLFFQDNGLDVVCTDLSPAMVAFCREKGLKAYEMDFMNLNFPPGSFDALYALNCLLHVPTRNLPVVLQKLRALLRPEGLFFLGVYGGMEREGVHEDDQHEPPRFFAHHTDEFMQQPTEPFFDLVSFKIIPIQGKPWHFQSLVLRRRDPDDQEIQIISLPEQDTSEPVAALSGPAKTRPSSRRLGLGLWVAIAVSLLLLALLVIQSTFPGLPSLLQDTLSSLGPAPTDMPIAGLPAGTNFYYFSVDVPWTNVFLDGHPIRLPRVGIDEPLWLSTGHHRFFWHAQPFSQHRCDLTVPPAPQDGCVSGPLLRSPSSRLQARVLFFHETLSVVPSHQRGELLKKVRAVLRAHQASDIVRPGEQYIGVNGAVTATAPVRATLNLQWDFDMSGQSDPGCELDARSTASNSCQLGGQDCLQLCTVAPWQFQGGQPPPALRTSWLAFAVVHVSWSFATGDGHVIARNLPPGFGATGATEHLVLLSIIWDGSNWQVDMPVGSDAAQPIIIDGKTIAANPACLHAEDQFSQDQQTGFQMRFVSGPNPAAGCLVVISAGNWTANQKVPFYLDRFGILRAANHIAQRMQPWLRPVDAYENSLVQQLNKMTGQIIVT
ncbi:MAG: class I SAM-dependent methyltransferase [Ktedonobacteraceae bacterium]|nr:class I SAM-dependent methyltransferase [Ktedonobacteraceae bacterium]